MKKSFLNTRLFVLVLVSLCLMVGCQKDSQLEAAQAFIKKTINCKSYEGIDEDATRLDEAFSTYFTEEGYKQYKTDHFIEMYPYFFSQSNIKAVTIKKIKCKEVIKIDDSQKTYKYEIKYNMQDDNKQTTSMTDYFDITMNKQNQITKVIILNKSDLIKKLFLDVKVQ